MLHPASVHSIPFGAPFLENLAEALLAWKGAVPEVLAAGVVFLPTRRAVREFTEALVRANGDRPLLLPRIVPLGDLDEDALRFQEWEREWEGALPGQESEDAERGVISPLRRVLLLARQVRALAGTRFQPSHEQSLRLAQALAAWLDDTAREEIPPERLETLAPEAYAEHWQHVLAFLRVVSEYWPRILAEEGLEDAVSARIRRLRRLAVLWQERPPAHYVLAAGSTGSIPATAALLSTIARLPEGAVVLPGLDTQMDDAAWNTLSPTHPQWGMAQLLTRMEVPRSAVRVFASAPDPRLQLLQAAMSPVLALPDVIAMEGLMRAEAATPEEEAEIATRLLLEAAHVPGKTAALVTRDRNLARRVAARTAREGVLLDDAAGTSLALTAPGVFYRLTAVAAYERFAPVPLLSLLKHPVAACGEAPVRCREAARAMEQIAFRGVRPREGWEGLAEACGEKMQPYASFLQRLKDALAPAEEWLARDEAPFVSVVQAHRVAAEALAASDTEAGAERLYKGDEGDALRRFLDGLSEHAEAMGVIDPATYLSIMDALLSAEPYRPRYGQHPRLHILSPQEARLMRFDLVIAGGLNEGSWPPDGTPDPWMSLPMRTAFGFAPREQRTGLAAHDFMHCAAAPEVVLLRSLKSAGTPATPARWLQRLDALLAPAGRYIPDVPMAGRVHMERTALRPPVPVIPPAPAPSVAVRPGRFSASDVQRLLRDPYAYYAAQILRLEPLPALDREPDGADFGIAVHRALERFHAVSCSPKDAESVLLKLGREAFAKWLHRPGVAAFWWERYRRIARWFAGEAVRRQAESIRLETEKKLERTWSRETHRVTLTARIDAAEHHADGTVALVDYKTGSIPTTKEILLGTAGQLALEAVLWPGPVCELAHWHLTGRGEGGSIHLFSARKLPDMQVLVDDAETGFLSLTDTLLQTPVPFAARHDGEERYHHLSRFPGWGGEDEGEDT